MRAVLHIGHCSVANLQHVGIVPVPRPRIRLQADLLVDNGQYAMRAATSVGPLLRSTPSILDVTGRSPKIAPHLLPPQPRLGRAPFADAQHDRSPRSVKSRADVGIRGLRILRSRTAPV